MDHNSGLTDDQDVTEYLKRDLLERKQDAPYKIIRDEIFGRHMVAARDIKPGEIILKEAPITFGPLDVTKPVCLGCYNDVNENSPKCPRCSFPVCSDACSEVPQHKNYECHFFLTKNYIRDPSKFNFNGNEVAYSAISPIRGLLIKEKDPNLWNLLWMQMSHHESRKKSDFWKKRTQEILTFMEKNFGLSDDDMKTVEILLGIFLVNDFEINILDRSQEFISSSATSIRAIYGLASMPNHSCVANTTHEFSTCKEGFVMTVRSIVAIKKGDDITHSYTEPLDSVLTRKSILKMGKFFECNCVRCSDPTEMGTYTSALLCSKCKTGNVVTSDVTTMTADWKCDRCDFKIDCRQVQDITSKIKVEANKIEPSESYTPSVDDYEKFLEKYSKVLHPNHVILVDKKYTLAKMYGRMEGYQPDQMSDEQFNRKRKLCEEVLNVFNKILPGRSRKRGMVMYELHLPLVMLANRAVQRGPGSGVNPDQIKSDLKAGLFNLRMGLEILKDEPENSFERKIVDGSKESVEQLDGWVKTVCQAL